MSGVFINRQAQGAIRNEDGVYIEPIASVLRTLGKPAKANRKNECETDYTWCIGDVRLLVWDGCVSQLIDGKHVSRLNGAYGVEVWGRHPTGKIGVTGLGLRLGDSWAKMKRIYGTHCQCQQYTDRTGTQNTHGFKYSYNAVYQWGAATSLTLDADAQGRIVHMQLMGDLE